MKIAFTQHAGLRKRRQEDCLWINNQLIQSVDLGINEVKCAPPVCIALADGVSSGPMPALASRELLRALAQKFQCNSFKSWDVKEAKNQLAREYEHTNARGAATTILVAAFRDGLLELTYCGNTRAYQIAKEGLVQQLTKDHTYLSTLEEAGLADPNVDYATTYNALTSCIVLDPEDDEYGPSGTSVATLEPSTWYLLCTDGVHDLIKHELGHLLSGHLPVKERAESIRKAVLQAGADDNFTLVVIDPWQREGQ